MHTDFVTYDEGQTPEYLPGPFEAKDIAENLGLKGIWGIHQVVTTAWQLNFRANTYNGEQAVAITKKLSNLEPDEATKESP